MGQWLFGFSRDEAFTVAGLTIPQAAATLAVTLIGFEIGLFSQTAVNAVVVLIVISCLLGPSLVRTFGTRLALAEAARPYEPASAPERILVPLANPETAEDLIELAMLMRSPASEEPVFPLTIARGGHEEAAHVAAAERVMQKAVLHATAADVPVSPTVRIDENATEGILRAAREIRASEIVAGWAGAPSAGDRVFRGVLDGVLEGSRAMVVVARFLQPLASAKRLVVLMPPLIWREAGFARALRAISVLATQTGMRVAALVAEDDHEAIATRIAQTKPTLAADVQPLANWGDAISALDAVAGPGDVITLLSVRQGTLAWRPALNRLPRILVRRFPQFDVLTIYLSESEVAAMAASAVEGQQEDQVDLPTEHIVLDLQPAEPETLLRRLFYDGFPEHPGMAARLAKRVASEHTEDAPEVMPGVVFYHAHVAEVEAPMTFVGVCRRGAALPDTGSPARVVLALLAPREMAPEAYLRHLAVVAQMVRTEETVEALMGAGSPEEARALLLERLRPEAV